MRAAYVYGSVAERFWPKVEKTETCWLWTAAIMPNGYGTVNVGDGRMAYAHRVAYQLEVGLIPEGLQLDHLCRIRRCVNPAHLEPVTIRENLMRGQGPTATRAAQTHCKRGHLFDEKNTALHGKYKTRSCRACDAMAQGERRARRKAAG